VSGLGRNVRGGAECPTGPRGGGPQHSLGLVSNAEGSSKPTATQRLDLLHTGALYLIPPPVTRRHTLCLPCQTRLAALGHALSNPLFGDAVRFRRESRCGRRWRTLGHKATCVRPAARTHKSPAPLHASCSLPAARPSASDPCSRPSAFSPAGSRQKEPSERVYATIHADAIADGAGR
jgi:hypothetical protein